MLTVSLRLIFFWTIKICLKILIHECMLTHKPRKCDIVLLKCLPAIEQWESSRKYEQVIKYVEKIYQLVICSKECNDRWNVPDSPINDHPIIYIDWSRHHAWWANHKEVVKYHWHKSKLEGEGVFLLHQNYETHANAHEVALRMLRDACQVNYQWAKLGE